MAALYSRCLRAVPLAAVDSAATATVGAASRSISGDLPAAGVSELDTEKRKAIYKEIQDLILQEMPYVMLAYYTKPVVMAANINDLPVGGASTERIFLQKVWMS